MIGHIAFDSHYDGTFDQTRGIDLSFCQVRILMAKKADRRSVEEIEFVIHYLDRFDYWAKIR